MIARVRPSLGLLGRILAVLLLTMTIEFGASTLLYERASRFSLREDEAHRLAEHLVVARKFVAERPGRERGAIARALTTERYDVRWSPSLPPPPPLAPELEEMRRQILTWEPTLAGSALSLRLTSPGRRSAVTGALRLDDGSWLRFATREAVHGWDLAIGRIVLALVPALGLLIVGALLIRRMLHPLRRLSDATQRIGFGEEVVVAEAGTAEVRRLTRAFNAMQARIHRLIEDRTLALAAVGHDLRTPLARMQLRLDAVRETAVREAIGGDVAEMDAMVASLLAFLGGEDDPEPPARIDLAVMMQTLVDDAADRGGDATYHGPDHLEATIRASGFRRALSNLIENALHYGKRVAVTLDPAGETIRLRVEDDGPGIPEDRLAAVMEPFVRLDAARARNTKGLGLGLSIAMRAVEREGGTLTLANRPEGGLRAEIALPAR